MASNKWDNFCIQTGRLLSLRCNDRVKEYSHVIQKISQRCLLLEIFTVFGGDTEDESLYEHYLSDGLHLNGEGNLTLYQAPMMDGEGMHGKIGVTLQEKL